MWQAAAPSLHGSDLGRSRNSTFINTEICVARGAGLQLLNAQFVLHVGGTQNDELCSSVLHTSGT